MPAKSLPGHKTHGNRKGRHDRINQQVAVQNAEYIKVYYPGYYRADIEKADCVNKLIFSQISVWIC